jgi:hypothetical protein
LWGRWRAGPGAPGSSVHPGRGGFIRPMQDASAPCDVIGRGCHQRDGFTGPGFWAGDPAPTTLRRSPVLAGDERRRHDARSACLGLSALCFRPSASVFNCRDSRSDRPLVPAAGRVHRGRVLGGKSRPIQRCVDHPPPLVRNAGVARPVPRALGFALCFRLSAACILATARLHIMFRTPGEAGHPSMVVISIEAEDDGTRMEVTETLLPIRTDYHAARRAGGRW